MAINSQTVQGTGVKGRVKCTPLQGTGVPPPPKYNNLEEWFQDNFEPNVRGVAENVEVVRTFYTYRPTPKSDISIWYADGEFGFYEGLPKRVADIHATHVVVEYPRPSGIFPKVELYVHTRDQETGLQRPIRMHELIEKVIHDDDEWKVRLPKVLAEWKLVFPKGESWGIMRIAGYPDAPGPSQHAPWVDSL